MKWTKITTDLTLATSGELFQKLANYVVLLVLSRYLTPDRMGQFFLAATLASFFAMLTSLGTGKHLIRGIAERPRIALRHLSDVLSLRLPLTAAAVVVLNAGVYLVRPDMIDVMLLTSIYVLVADLYYSIGAFFIGLRRVGLRFATGLTGPVLLVVLVVIAREHGATLNVILGCFIVANAVMLTAALLIVRLMFGRLRLRWDVKSMRRIVTVSWPFFLLIMLGALQFKVDTVMIWVLVSDAAVASYETAYRLLEVSRLMVRPAAVVFFPVCTAMAARGDWGAFGRTLRKLLIITTAVGLGIAGVVIVAAGLIMPIIWGETYAGGAPILRVLFLTVPMLYPGFVGAFMVNALHLEKSAVRIMLVCLLVNIVLNSVAIPRWEALGAAWTTLASETLLTVWLLGLIVRRLRVQTADAKASTAAQDFDGRERIVKHDTTL